ncbi:hypothetical protein RIF29_03731 [Crotalaria pallida]|uniref:Uncharacterized protein n=1 Tax=Crotalaria pallida TaxID=3830 RepID=A0AAN9P9L4_CROPI
MARKRGRPPNQLDDEDISDLDNLSPKQAELLLKNLDAVRENLKGIAPATQIASTSDEAQKSITSEPSASNPIFEKRPFSCRKHVKKVWVEKKKPSKEDIEKVDDTLKLKRSLEDGTIPEENVASALECVKELEQLVTDTSVIDALVVQNTPQKESEQPDNQSDDNQEGWTTVITRSKGNGRNKGGASPASSNG